MSKRLVTIISLIFFLLSANFASAGLGITPPYVRNNSLARDSQYEQKIIISRSDPVEDLRAEITINVPGANDWIEIDKGNNFLLPKGESQVPMTVHLKVPKKAKFGSYTGNIRVVLSAADNPTPGTVGIALGAQIDVNLSVIDQKIYDFKIRGVSIADVEEGHKFFGFFFPGKIRFSITVENIGNVAFGPTKVVFEIRDNSGAKLLETTENINNLTKVKPFDITPVLAEIPTRLGPGSYRATYRIYKNEEIAQQGELNLSVLPYGSIPGYNGFGFWGLRGSEQITIIAILLAILAVLGTILRYTIRYFRRRRVPRPPRYQAS